MKKKEKDISEILKFKGEKEKIEFEMEMIHLDIMNEIEERMEGMKKKDVAKKVGTSASMITQLFAGDKIINLDLMARFQRALNFKFEIKTVANENQSTNKEAKIVDIEHSQFLIHINKDTSTTTDIDDTKVVELFEYSIPSTLIAGGA
jgi:ribosome-binding protein aMBF1 (putative translation factor)